MWMTECNRDRYRERERGTQHSQSREVSAVELVPTSALDKERPLQMRALPSSCRQRPLIIYPLTKNMRTRNSSDFITKLMRNSLKCPSLPRISRAQNRFKTIKNSQANYIFVASLCQRVCLCVCVCACLFSLSPSPVLSLSALSATILCGECE